MTFTYWLCQQTHRNDLIGELAQQVRRLDDWPKVDTYLACKVYLARDAATHLGLRALDMAYQEWESSKDQPYVNVSVGTRYRQAS